jgi:hypothetical protein
MTMSRIVLTVLFAWFAIAPALCAEPLVHNALLLAARKALPEEISASDIGRGLSAGLWNPNGTAVAASFARPKSSLIFAFLRQPDGNFLAVDVSRVEGANLGKLGTAGRAGFERCETMPVKWLPRDDGLFQVVMRTRAWKAGQRHTASEPLVVKPDGTPVWR